MYLVLMRITYAICRKKIGNKNRPKVIDLKTFVPLSKRSTTANFKFKFFATKNFHFPRLLIRAFHARVCGPTPICLLRRLVVFLVHIKLTCSKLLLNISNKFISFSRSFFCSTRRKLLNWSFTWRKRKRSVRIFNSSSMSRQLLQLQEMRMR